MRKVKGKFVVLELIPICHHVMYYDCVVASHV